MEAIKHWAVLDYVVFGLIVILSCVIGIFFGFKHRKKMTASEYLIANRSLSWFPLCISMVASFFSSITVIGFVSQVYLTGVTFAFQAFAFLPPIILAAEVFVPLFRRLELTSVNEYLELRYSKGIRLLGCLLFTLQYIVFLSILLYVPSVKLENETNIPKIGTIVITGVLCTLYTTIGGMRGVVWTHVFQFVIMIIAILGVAVGGVIKIGSFEYIYNTTVNYERMKIEYNPDPRTYHTVWGSLIGLQFALFPLWTIGQPIIQRVISIKELKDSKKALYCSFVFIILIIVILTFDGLVIFTAFIGCDPIKSGKIAANDQILPHYVIQQFNAYMGIPGLFIAALFCFAQSTMSSTLNSMSAMFLEDIVKSVKPTITDYYQTVISRVVACMFGLFVTGFAFVIPIIGDFVVQLVIELFSVIGGPYFAIFFMGVFTRRANSAGAAIGSILGLGVGCALIVGQIIYPADRQLPPVSTSQCTSVLMANETFVYIQSPKHDNLIADIVSVSYLWNGLISVLVTCVVCLLVSLCCSRCSDSAFLDKKLLYRYRGCCLCNCSCSCCKEKADYDCEVYDQELIRSGPFADREDNYGDTNT